MNTTWEHIAADKRGRIDRSIPSEWRISLSPQTSAFDIPAKSGVLSPQELQITESTATDLVSRLGNGELKAVDVTLAFCKRAALAHQLVSSNNCLEPSITYAELRTKIKGQLCSGILSRSCAGTGQGARCVFRTTQEAGWAAAWVAYFLEGPGTSEGSIIHKLYSNVYM